MATELCVKIRTLSCWRKITWKILRLAHFQRMFRRGDGPADSVIAVRGMIIWEHPCAACPSGVRVSSTVTTSNDCIRTRLYVAENLESR
mmetsp:Transcript_35863/g.55944  ORF Transcript_35863/g.55944 Transcript_35863/m.55944 type:complete len:89 (+) Transcript_35863:225-491(+)